MKKSFFAMIGSLILVLSIHGLADAIYYSYNVGGVGGIVKGNKDLIYEKDLTDVDMTGKAIGNAEVEYGQYFYIININIISETLKFGNYSLTNEGAIGWSDLTLDTYGYLGDVLFCIISGLAGTMDSFEVPSAYYFWTEWMPLDEIPWPRNISNYWWGTSYWQVNSDTRLVPYYLSFSGSPIPELPTVPEPSTMLLLGSGLLGLAGFARRKLKK